MDGELSKRVVVAVRVRPKLENVTNATQVAERYHPEAATRVNETTIRLSETKGKDTKTNVFSFDHVFDRDCTQQEVYEDTTLEAIDAALQGSNATVMTYGQTGSGKTYTVLGSVKSNPLSDDVLTPDTGLFLRVLRDVLSFAENRAADTHTVVCLSVMEIYLESIRDLLSANPGDGIKMSVDGENLRMPDLTYIPITQLRDAIDAYKVATNRRVCRATEANDQSSRSHALFSIDVYQQQRTEKNPEPFSCEQLTELRTKFEAKKKPNTPSSPSSATPASNPLIPCPGLPPIMYSRIVLTDLAGSEKMKHSNAKGESFEEMKKINGSLTSLGNVVHSLYSGAKHIPYRDSKLTLLLRSSFAAPNARVVLIANTAPTSLTFDETLSTMFFANKVKAMKVANTGAVDLGVESAYLQTLRQLEELGSELRVVKEMHDHKPIAKVLLPSDVYSKGCNLYLNGLSLDANAKKKEKLLKEHAIGPLQERTKEASENKKSGRAGELQELFDAVVKEIVDDFEKALAHQQSLNAKMEKEIAEDNADADAYAEEVKTEVAEEEKQSAALETTLKGLQSRHTALPIDVKKTETELEVLTKQYEEMERKFMEAHSEEEDAWKALLVRHGQEDKAHDGNKAIVEDCVKFWELRSEFVDVRKEVMAWYDEGLVLQKEVETTEITEWIHRAVTTMGNNAVTLSLRAAAKARAPKSRPVAPRGRGESSPTPGSPTPGSPAPAPQTPSSPRAPGPSSRPKAPPRQVSLYDQPKLLDDIESYIQNGTTLLKHGRNGTPHYRFFYVMVSETSCRLCWDTEDTGKRDGTGSSIDLSRVTKIVSGQSSEVFLRTRSRDGFLNSFSIHYIKKQEFRTLDIVCDTEAEFEAWVIGLSRIIGSSPCFEDRKELEGVEDADKLSEAETTLCKEWFLEPKLVLSVKKKVKEIGSRRRTGRPKLTPGDIRFIAQVDVFRASALWNYLDSVELVQSPNPVTMRNYLKMNEM